MKNETFITSDKTKLQCRLWDNVAHPRGVVQIIHGMDDHVGRYDRFAKFLNKNGYIVFGDDHRAHGRTAGSPDKIGRVGNESDLFRAIVADETEILMHLRARFGVPVFVFGHSYGSFITQRLMQHTNLCAAGVCLAGSARYPVLGLAIAAATAWCGARLFGADAPARFLEFWSPTRGANGARHNMHTRDAAQAALRAHDPMHAKHFSYGFYLSLFRNLMGLPRYANPDLPVLIISGSRDIINMNGWFAKSLYRAYKSHNLERLTIIIYPGARHELLMETNYDEVQHDIVQFFNSVLK